MNFSQTGGGILALAGGALWLALMIYWVVLAWRATSALQGIEEALRERNSR